MSQPTPPAPEVFFRERLPAQMNRQLAEQQEAAAAAQRALEGMRGVDATLRFDVRGPGGGVWYVNFAAGQAAAGASPAHPPFLSIALDRDHFEPLWREAGDNVLGFLGGVSGMGAPIKLTRSRVEQLAAVKGALLFELTGAGGFRLVAQLGGDLPAEDTPPATAIRVDAQAYRELRSGALQPQDAFLAGKIQVEGDMQLAMQLALAVLSPD
ncbi:MAG TPA: SCP2 sterol-binding domain-containing protein [Myxococcota bacterium]|nr:SCP2 sterol-binding domain-containing protein [Myxococcota bacterium]